MLNHITLQGRFTRDPELRHTQTGIAVCSFTLAVERDAAAEDGKRKADFIDCIAWRGAGEFVCKHFRKGSAAVVIGRLEVNDWTDKEGNKRRSAVVKVGSIYFGESKKDGGNAQEAARDPADHGTANFEELPEDDSDLPF